MISTSLPVGQGWVVVTRLLLPLALLGGVLAVPMSVALWALLGAYGLANFVFLASLLWISGRDGDLSRAPWIRPALALLLVCEHGLIGALVVADGSGASDFGLLFVMLSTLAGFLFGRFGVLVSSGLTLTIMGGLVASQIGVLPLPLELLPIEPRTLIFRWLVLTGESVLLGSLTAFLATSLQYQKRVAEGRARDLEMARLDLDGVLNRLSYGVVVVEPNDRVLYFNSSAVALLRSSLHPGVRLDDVALGETWGGELLVLVEQVRAGRHDMAERECRTEAGGWLRLQVAGTLLEGRLRSLVITLDDITPIRRMEEEVRNAERMATLGHMAARIAHEIRNPLASITGSSQLLGENKDLEADDRQLLALIRRESGRLDRILAEFLDYSRTRKPSVREFAPLDVVREVVEMVRARAGAMGKSDVLLEVKALGAAPVVVLDRDMLVQILSNLGINALQALSTDRQGRVVFEVEGFEGGIRFRVRDNGVGMGPEVLAKMGEAFFTTRQGGVGLGVAITRQLTSLLGGTFRVQSLEGRGTIVEVAFPVPD